MKGPKWKDKFRVSLAILGLIILFLAALVLDFGFLLKKNDNFLETKDNQSLKGSAFSSEKKNESLPDKHFTFNQTNSYHNQNFYSEKLQIPNDKFGILWNESFSYRRCNLTQKLQMKEEILREWHFDEKKEGGIQKFEGLAFTSIFCSNQLFDRFFEIKLILGMGIIAFLFILYHVIILQQKGKRFSHKNQAKNSWDNISKNFLNDCTSPCKEQSKLVSKENATPHDLHKVAQCLDQLIISSRVLIGMMDEIMDLTPIDQKKIKIVPASFDFYQLISSVTAKYYLQFKNKGVQFDVILPGVTEGLLIGDALRLNEILFYLLSASVKSTEPGGAVKLIVTQNEKKEGKVVLRFSITDSGCGINPKEISRLFESLERKRKMGIKLENGSEVNIGLAKKLVDLMQGEFIIQSQIGIGTTFIVDLPFQEVKQQSCRKGKFKNLRALVVNRDRDIAEYISVVLERIGVPHDIVESPKEAIVKLKEAQSISLNYHVCFVDCSTYSDQGIEIVSMLRENFDQESLTIILSVYELAEIEEKARQAGVNFFVEKPLFQSTVFNVLMKISGGQYTKLTASKEDYHFNKERILLIEDDPLNREIAVEILTMVNLKVETAEDGESGLKKFLSSSEDYYRTILMDIQLPGMNGYETTEAIRNSSHPCAARIPILAMTAHAFAEDISAALSSGMNGHIAKPIDTEVLYDTLKRVMEKE